MDTIKHNKKYFQILKEILDSPLGKHYKSNPKYNNIDNIQIGADGNTWIIHKTKYGNTWKKYVPDIDFQDFFDNITDDSEYVKDVYYPDTQSITFNQETGTENKFGGHIPFFINDEEWPLDNDDEPMVFLCQFIDPRKNDNILHRVFNSLNLEDYHVNQIELNEENLKNQIIIKNPLYDKFINQQNKQEDNEEDNKLEYNIKKYILEPFIITKWDKSKELINIRKINLKFNLPEEHNSYLDIYDNHMYAPIACIKICGTSNYCQYQDDIDDDENIIIQLTEQNILNFTWGDCGIAHVYNNYIEFDCC